MLAQSETVTLRRLSPDDFKLFMGYRNDPEIARFQSWEKMDAERALRFLTFCADADPLLKPGEWIQIAVASPDSQTLLGDMGWFLSKDETEAEVGITLARAYHGKGIAQSAMNLAISYLFTHTPIERIICGADQRNTRSLHLIRKLGFRFTHTENTDSDGARDDMFELHRTDPTLT